MQKISFEIAKKVLDKSKLLLSTSTRTDSESWGFPQVQADKIQKGDIFIAFRGTRHDAHDFIPLAIKCGAQCIVLENESKVPPQTQIPYLLVSDARAAWSALISAVHNHPENNLNLFGVTGTDGKTSTVWIASQLVRKASGRCLSLGTLGIFDGNSHRALDHTTPDPPVFFSALESALNEGISSVIMEVSSHSLIQGKLQNIHFDGAVFTSFSRDHLDFHKNLDEYFSAKCLLFTKHLKKNAKAFIHHKLLSKFPVSSLPSSDLWTYGFDPDRKVEYKNHIPLLESKPGNKGQLIKFQLRGKIITGEIPYLGIHNAENFIAALMIAEQVLGSMPAPDTWMGLLPIPGRCEFIDSKSTAPKVYVDFAHTPTGLKTILETLRPYTKGKLWIVFGCGGDRDRGKRPEMAKAAQDLADRLILSSDNPRNENPQAILDEMKAGLAPDSDAIDIVDRERAIQYAIREASVDDTILIAGKGHESFQILGDKKIPFSDQTLAQYYLKLFWETK